MMADKSVHYGLKGYHWYFSLKQLGVPYRAPAALLILDSGPFKFAQIMCFTAEDFKQ